MLNPRLTVKEIRKDGVLMEGPSVDVGGGSPWIARLRLFSLGNILIVPPYSQSSSGEYCMRMKSTMQLVNNEIIPVLIRSLDASLQVTHVSSLRIGY